MTAETVLYWFRQDLRLIDNPALAHAAGRGQVLPVYILDDHNAGDWRMGGASRWWLHQSLQALNQSLDGRLWILRGDPLTLIPELLNDQDITQVFWNRCYEPWRIARDRKLKAELESNSIEVHSYNGSLLWEPWEIKKQDGTPYRVFTPFYNKGCLGGTIPRVPDAKPLDLQLAPCKQPRSRFDELGLLPDINWYDSIAEHWTPGARGALARLDEFLDDGLQDYSKGRDFPARPSVSGLSPHLHFGELSPHQAWHAAQGRGTAAALESQVEHFQRELGWREFSYYLLYHFPGLPRRNFNASFDDFPWREDEQAYQLWCQGQTGYPIVDAGMRELWHTGYMHNRVRMIVASFLVKNLLIHWQRGEEWFWDCLVDADLANNSASWQWVAGSGADAAPYFRIFNPVTQGYRFDPQAEYVRRWVPEIAALPDKFIHDPGNAPIDILSKAGIQLDRDYPSPLVELKPSRQKALDAYQKMRSEA